MRRVLRALGDFRRGYASVLIFDRCRLLQRLGVGVGVVWRKLLSRNGRGRASAYTDPAANASWLAKSQMLLLE